MKTSKTTSVSVIPVKREAESAAFEKNNGRVHLKKDTWVFNDKKFRMVEGAMPSSIAAAFEKPVSPPKNAAPYEYDRSKLSVYCISGVTGADIAARVELRKGPFFIADVIPKEDEFIIQVYPTGQGLFPMSPAEFLRAIYAAKLNLFLKTDDSDDDI